MLFEPDSGVLAAGECLRALRDCGAVEVRTGVRVTSLHQGDRDVSIHTADGDELRADVVVDCAGPGALSLVTSGADRSGLVAAAPSLPQVAYFRSIDRAHDATGLPVFIEWGPDMIYGLPVPATSVGSPHALMYKVSHHTPGMPPLGPFDPSMGEPLAGDDPALVALLTSAVARLLPALDPDPVATERCVYDNTVDSDFVIDRIGRIVVGCGTSGHGFKFGPLLGEMLADLALGTGASRQSGEPTPVDLGLFALDRVDMPLPHRPDSPANDGRLPDGASVRRPPSKRQRRGARPHCHERSPGVVRRPRVPRHRVVHPDRQRPLHGSVQEREGARHCYRATARRRLRRFARGTAPHGG